VGAEISPNLYKRQLFLQTIRALVEKGISVPDLQQIIPARKFLGVPGKLDGGAFRKAASEMKTPTGSTYDFRRFYVEDENLFFSDSKTWALSNQWSINFLPQLNQLMAKYPQSNLSYKIAGPNPQ
jgi:hypothetical protein